ncbi:lytic transglycosylase domain-containing protein [Lichenibacterium dinghuense]|uniref:lytic transglycosylase domain-containing protein n=1 Tax=Lichenibacterium dinghuense TaxID=2895977 RepID=UPI001F1ACC48|nr:lytic transglycosylase domain-containing protein [Lichenibacterium sp. 6Y81]
MSRAVLATGALLVSASLASADGQAHFSPLLQDTPTPPIAAAPAPAPVAEQAPAGRTRSGRRRTRIARERERRVARAAAALNRSVDPFGGIRHLTIGSTPAPLPPSHEGDVGSAVATLETPPPGNREAAAPTPGTSAATFEGAREAASHSLAELLAKHAFAEGVPVALAKAVVRIESGGNARASNHGALGLMQIKWATARAVGFSGPAVGLLVADTNLRYGMKVLAQAYRDAHGDVCGALMRYQSGHLARHPNAANRAYCAHARSLMARD